MTNAEEEVGSGTRTSLFIANGQRGRPGGRGGKCILGSVNRLTAHTHVCHPKWQL